MNKRSLAALLMTLLITASGCALGYRYQDLSAEQTKRGVNATASGREHAATASVVLDFRVVRFLYPFERLDRYLAFTDDVNGRGSSKSVIMARAYRLDAPVISFWSVGSGFSAGYPGLMHKRQSLEVWGGFESDLATDPTVWGDLSLMYYHYNIVGVRLFGGYGSQPYRGSTNGIDAAHPLSWSGRAGGFGGGIEVTVTAGEYALEFVQWLLDLEDQQRKVLGDR